MSRYILGLMILLAMGMALTACGGEEAETAMNDGGAPAVTIVDNPEVHGWIEIALADAPPSMVRSGEDCTWLLLDAGNLLRFNLAEGDWSYYSLEGIPGGGVTDFAVSGSTPVLLTANSLLVFDPVSGEVRTEELPDGIDPVLMGSSGTTVALVDETGDLVLRSEEGFEVCQAPEELAPFGQLVTLGPDWVFMLEDGGLAFCDPAEGLWQFEESPEGQVLAAAGNDLFLGAGEAVLSRISPSTWEAVSEGRLYSGGLILTPQGIAECGSPALIAESPSFTPAVLVASSGSTEPLWAVDDLGLTAYAELGTVDPTLSFYEAERVSCSLAGQDAEESGSSATIEELITSGSGAFRIYESVSTRPDPFTAFSLESRDIRRDIANISIEELRLVGITLDPVGGDQALVEDANLVSYILYEGTELKNNTHVAEITSNEVIVIQDVIVDYTATGGGVTTIPTIYSMRLYEEGGL